jgi:nucleoside-diphosphate-sugar epimerase
MNKNPDRSVVIAGCGYVGLRLGRAHLARGDRVMGIRRSREAGPLMREAGIRPLITDLAAPDLSGVETIDRVYYLAPPPPQGDADAVLGGFLEVLADRSPAVLVYVGTTGVYGDCAGAWIDEQTPLRPTAPRARRRADAERRVSEFLRSTDWRGSRLRVGGIYGPGRLPLARLRQGEPVLCPEESPYSNRIHVDDLVAACLAAGEGEWADEVFNIVDGHPSTMTDYFYAVADAAGIPRPPCIPMAEAEARFSPAMMSYLRESRRIDNRPMRERLGIALRYADLRRGLDAALREGGAGRRGAVTPE